MSLSILAQWEEAKRNAKYWQEEERRLRGEIIKASSGGAPLKEGTNTFTQENGQLVFKVVQPFDYKVDLAAMKTIGPALIEIYEVDPNTLINWKPELKISAYRELSDAAREFVAQALTIKPGSCQLEVKRKDTSNEPQ